MNLSFPAAATRWCHLLVVGMALAGCASIGPPTAPKAPVVAPVQAPSASLPVAKAPARIGLALGGGAARGFAHVGVIQVLEEAGIRPDMVVGTSAGSLVAALYASGRNGAQLQQVAESLEEAALTDWTLPIFGRGALKGEALARYVSSLVNHKLIEEMPMPLGIVATDLGSGQGVLFRRGSTGTAVRASSAVPSVFQPVTIAGRDYVDGGLVSPVPVGFTRQMGQTWSSLWTSPAHRKARPPATRCRSCCRPLPSCPRASTVSS